MNAIDLIIDLHRRNDRQGPGSTAHTHLAIELAGLKLSAGLAVADVGCGAGAFVPIRLIALGHHRCLYRTCSTVGNLYCPPKTDGPGR